MDDNEEKLEAAIAALLLAGVPQNQIAKRVDLTDEELQQRIQSILQRWQADILLGSDNTLDLMRINRIINTVWGRAQRGDTEAINILAKLITQRQKIEEDIRGAFPASPAVPGQVASRDAYSKFQVWASDAPWYQEYMHLRQEEGSDGKPRWDWRKAVFIAWSSMPTTRRWPKTQAELAETILGCTDRAIRKWKEEDPGIEERIAHMSGAYYLLKYRSAVFEAMAEVASSPDPRGHSDRRLFLELTGDYTPRSKVEQSGPDGGPMVHLELGVDLENYSEEELDQLIANLQTTISQSSLAQESGGQSSSTPEPARMDDDPPETD